MSGFLLDVDVVIALVDPDHVQHLKAHHWFVVEGMSNWATTPTVQNGAVRILSHP